MCSQFRVWQIFGGSASQRPLETATENAYVQAAGSSHVERYPVSIDLSSRLVQAVVTCGDMSPTKTCEGHKAQTHILGLYFVHIPQTLHTQIKFRFFSLSNNTAISVVVSCLSISTKTLFNSQDSIQGIIVSNIERRDALCLQCRGTVVHCDEWAWRHTLTCSGFKPVVLSSRQLDLSGRSKGLGRIARKGGNAGTAVFLYGLFFLLLAPTRKSRGHPSIVPYGRLQHVPIQTSITTYTLTYLRAWSNVPQAYSPLGALARSNPNGKEK